VPAARVVDRTVQTIDIMPTILEMSGLRAPAAAQGRSLVPLLAGPGSGTVQADGPKWDDRPAITEKLLTPRDGAGGAPPPRDTESFAIVARGYKLIHNTKRAPATPEFELFDRDEDPLDRTNVADAHPDVVQSLSREIDAWRKQAESARLKPDAESTKALGKEDLERLRALGYVQ
jgi:arylsulfatase A-like enzyme